MLQGLDPRLPLIQDANVAEKVVLVRVDHNVVKRGLIKDPYRIEAGLGTLFNIVSRCGLLVLMSHVGRPRDKRRGTIDISYKTSVDSLAEHLEYWLGRPFIQPEVDMDGEWGIPALGESVQRLLPSLRLREIGGIYLPNTRWFSGEEGSDQEKQSLARELESIADIYVNDAFGSWQSHVSTHTITKYLPSYAGILMQREITGLQQVLDPEPPFLAVIAGSKFDTKIGSLRGLYERVDRLMLGGILYNGYLCAKYGIHIRGISETEVLAASLLVEKDRGEGKIIEPPFVIESDTLDGRFEGRYRIRRVQDFRPGQRFAYFVDVAPESFEVPEIEDVFTNAGSIFVNAVMGLMPFFHKGTVALNMKIDRNKSAMKLFGGGDTLQEMRRLTPGMYLRAEEDPGYYLFTGGGTVLEAIKKGSPYALPTVEALIENGGRDPLTARNDLPRGRGRRPI